MYGDYVDWNIFQDTGIQYFGANKYNEYYEFTIDRCICHVTTLQALGKIIPP